MFFKWAQIEPQKNVFDWFPIDASLANSNNSSTPPNFPVQVRIDVGDGGTPDSEAVCHSYSNLPGDNNPPACQPWLASIAGVHSHWRATNGGNTVGGINTCGPTYNPAPWDTAYQSAIQGFAAAFNARYSGSHISMINLNPVGPDGHNMGLDVSVPNQTCADWSNSAFYTTGQILHPASSPNLNYNETVDQCQQGHTEPAGFQQGLSTVQDGTCVWQKLPGSGTFTENYNDAWNALAQTAPGPDGPCASHDNTCWEKLVSDSVNTIISQQVAAMPNVPNGYWLQTQNWPDISGAQGATDNDNTGIKHMVFSFAQAHQSPAGTWVVYEGLKNTANAYSLLSPWINGANALLGGVQMVGGLSGGPGQCTALCGALLPCGACESNPIGFAQVYVPDLQNCPNTVAAYNSVLAGDPHHYCQSDPACPASGTVTCNQ